MAKSSVFKYHCEPASENDARLIDGDPPASGYPSYARAERPLRDQLDMATDYRRELALIENRGRALWRSMAGSPASSSLRDVARERGRMRALVEDRGVLVKADEMIERTRGHDRDSRIVWLEEIGVPAGLARSMVDEDRVIAAIEETRGGDPEERVRGIESMGIPADLARMMVDKDRASEAQAVARRAARASAVERGLHWGTYQDVEEAFSTSCRTTPVFDDVRVHAPRGVGSAAVHLQPPRALRDDDPWIRVGEIVRHGSEIDRSGRARPARHREVLLRIGTQADRSPRWAVLHVLMHRPLPAGGLVSWAKAKRRVVGGRSRWELHVTVKFSDASGERRPLDDDGSTDGSIGGRASARARARAVGVDIGWRQMGDRVRIASWWGTDGRSGQVEISNYVLNADAKADDLRAIRDGARNSIRDAIRLWVSTLSGGDEVVPWIVEETASIHSWLKPWRFARLAVRWRGERIPGDDEIYGRVAAWFKQDRHLWAWEGAIREQRKRRVDEYIRLLAVDLGRSYERIGIEAPMVARLVRRTQRCLVCAEETGRCGACRDEERMRRIAATRVPHAAPARTRQEIKVFGERYRSTVIEFSPACTTMDCASCGHRRADVEDWSALVIRCPACGVAEDQDVTAGRNLARLASDSVLGADGRPLASDKLESTKKKIGARRNRKAARG